jgi:hypothetical protein
VAIVLKVVPLVTPGQVDGFAGAIREIARVGFQDAQRTVGRLGFDLTSFTIENERSKYEYKPSEGPK